MSTILILGIGAVSLILIVSNANKFAIVASMLLIVAVLVYDGAAKKRGQELVEALHSGKTVVCANTVADRSYRLYLSEGEASYYLTDMDRREIFPIEQCKIVEAAK